MSFEKTKQAIQKVLKIDNNVLECLPLIHLIIQASAWAFVNYEELDDETKTILKQQMNNLKKYGSLNENL